MSDTQRHLLYREELTWWEKLFLSKELISRYETGKGLNQTPNDAMTLHRVGQWSREYRRIDRLPWKDQAAARFAENRRVDAMYCPCNRRPVVDNPYRCETHFDQVDSDPEPDPTIRRDCYDGFR